MHINAKKKTLIIAIVLVANACTPPKSVTNLAKTTSANVSLVSSSIAAYSERNKRSAARRSAYIQDVDNAAIDLASEYSARMGALKLVENAKKRAAGETKSARIEATLAYLDSLREIEIDAASQRASFESAIKQDQARNALSDEELKALAESLSILAKEKSADEMLGFLRTFLEETVSGLNESEDSADRSNSEAEAIAAGAASTAVNAATDQIKAEKKKSD